MSGMDLVIDKVKNRHQDMREMMSQGRKKGHDMSIATLKSLDVPAKIKMLEATRDYKDVKIVNDILDDVAFEIKQATPQQPTANGEKTDERMLFLLHAAEKSIAAGNPQDALKRYNDARLLYPKIPDDMKKETYKKLVELYNQIQKR